VYIGIGPLAGDPTHHIEARLMSQLVAIYCIFTYMCAYTVLCISISIRGSNPSNRGEAYVTDCSNILFIY
jgi:hypothetical protein